MQKEQSPELWPRWLTEDLNTLCPLGLNRKAESMGQLAWEHCEYLGDNPDRSVGGVKMARLRRAKAENEVANEILLS